jgi:hypothetical protein
MTPGHPLLAALLLAAVTTTYIFVDIWLDERDLIA